MKKWGVLFFIFVILFSHLAVNYHIVSASRFFQVDDEADRVEEGYFCYESIHFGNIEAIKSHLFLLRPYPPLLKFTQAFWWWILNIYRSANINSVILLTNFLFLFVLLISVYGIGNQLYGRKVGLLSAFLISMFPIVFGHSRIAMMEFPLAGMTSLTLYLLLKSRHFSLLAYSLLAGIAFGLAQLTKPTAHIFIIPPLVYYFFQSMPEKERSKTIRNSFLFLSSSGIIAGMVYLRPDNLGTLGAYIQKMRISVHANELDYYFNNFFALPGPLILIVCLPLVVSYLINIRHREKLILYWFLIPFIFFSLLPNRVIRFILPLSVPFCLMVTQELFNNVLFKKIRAWYISIIVIIAICQYVLLNSGLLKMENKMTYIHFCGILTVKQDKYYPAATSLFDIFKKKAGQDSSKSKNNVIFLFNIPKIQDYLQVNSSLYQLPFRMKTFVAVDEADAKVYINSDLEKEVATADYIVDKDGERGVLAYAKIIEERLSREFNKSKDKFKLISTIGLYDGSNIYVYKRIK